MEITTQSNLKAEKLEINTENINLELAIINLLNGTYLIADAIDSDSEYPSIIVSSLEKDIVKTELEEYLWERNIVRGYLTSEEIDKIADAIEKLNL